METNATSTEPLQERTAVERLIDALKACMTMAYNAPAKDGLRYQMVPTVLLRQTIDVASELERLQALVGRLEGALRPFAEAARDADELTIQDTSDAWESSMAMSVTFGDFRAARQALHVEGGGREDNSSSVAGAQSSLRSDQQAQNSAGGGE